MDFLHFIILMTISHCFAKDSTVTLEGLMKQIEAQDLTIAAQEKKFKVLEKELNNQRVTNIKLQSKLEESELDHKHAISELLGKITTLDSKMQKCELNHRKTTSEILNKMFLFETRSNQAHTQIIQTCDVNNKAASEFQQEIISLREQISKSNNDLVHIAETSDLNYNLTMSSLLASIARLEQNAQINTSSLESQIAHVAASVGAIGHVESGSINCGGPFGWGGNHTDPWLRDLTVSFRTAYLNAPHVVVAVNHVAWDGVNGSFYLLPEHVSERGFTLECGVYYQTSHVREIYATWLAHP